MQNIHNIHLEPLIDRALAEDWGASDWTTDLCVPVEATAEGCIIAKSRTLVSGTDVAKAVFYRVDPALKFEALVKEGDPLHPGDTILKVSGSARSLLKAERVVLNFLARMCGISYQTRLFVDELAPFKTQLLDTRKTTPGMRLLEKAATARGGARNHRLCLTDGVLVKENHIRAAGGITAAVNRLLESLPPTLKIEVETTCLSEVHEALEAGADLIMLDNMTLSEMALAVRTVRGRVLLEASGNVTLDNLRKIAETGVDFISSGAIIHSAHWADLSMQLSIS